MEIENITVRNDAGDGRDVGQAVAVYAAGDRGVFRNVKMIAHQDTLFCGPVNEKVRLDALPREIYTTAHTENLGSCPPVYGRVYLEDCFIQGDVDFIFGPYRCWFERCTLFMNPRGGIYTAANTPEPSPYGMVFHRCRLTGACEPGKAALGRPWRADAACYWLDCVLSDEVCTDGWDNWRDPENEKTARFGEHGSTGPGSAAKRAFGSVDDDNEANAQREIYARVKAEFGVE